VPAKIYYDQDADLSLLAGKTIAILGYGSQGRGQALNLRDSGCRVIVAELPDTANCRQAVADGFQPISAAEATRQADLVALLLPDELQADVFRREIRDNLTPSKVLVCAHGFNVHFGQIDVPDGVATILVAPTGPGQMLRAQYVRGHGIPCLIALAGRPSQADGSGATAGLSSSTENAADRLGAGPDALQLGLAYAKAIGGTRAGVIETTFAEETEADLFGEQAVLCGGLSALMKAGFDTLVEAGYQPELAYFECIHQVKLLVDLIYQGGLSYMRDCISNTAEYGDYTRGPRVIGEASKAEMKRILAEIRDGRFAREWIAESWPGAAALATMRQREQSHPSEEIGRRLRELMPWINAKEE
jgi:ketol-acid reductoisomerase